MSVQKFDCSTFINLLLTVLNVLYGKFTVHCPLDHKISDKNLQLYYSKYVFYNLDWIT